MQVDWHHFTPIASLTGGVLIGTAVFVLYVFNGRYAGISGILSKLLNPQHQDHLWRLLFIIGLLLSPLLWQLYADDVHIDIPSSPLTLGISGLLVGIGTAYASGCTSGHGVIGLSRGSKRSIYAVIIFMFTAIATHYLFNDVFN